MEKIKKTKNIVFCIILFSLFGYIVCEKTNYLSAENTGFVHVTGTLNVREGCGTNYKVVGSLANGTQVTILEDNENGWYKIKNDTLTGYVSSQYIVFNEIDEGYKQQLVAGGFPESYADSLALLHAKYPKWEFTPMQTGLDWNTVIANETALGKNNVSSSSESSWKSVEKGAYGLDTKKWVEMDGASWVPASKGITEYYIDPRNFLDETNIFLYLNNTYDSSKQTEEFLNAMVNETFLANTYKENDKSIKYSTTLIEAAKQSQVNPYVLASMMLIEQGNNGQGKSISGTVENYEGYYNHFNIGAYATSTMSAIERSLWFAKGAGINSTTYNRPWNSITSSICGGAQYYGKNYVQAGQNTLYLKKFNVQGSFIYNHQYMTNIQGAVAEAQKLAKAYKSILDSNLTFYIPVYNNMPSSAAGKPAGDGDPNNYLKCLEVNGYPMNPIFDTYTQEYTLIINSENPTIHITAEPYESTSVVSGAGDLTLTEGMNSINITVQAQNGMSRTYHLNISKSGGTSPTETGTSTPSENDGNENAGESTQAIYGDVNGDGKITIVDLLKVQKVILGLEELDSTSSNAADANQDGKISIADLLKIQKQLLNIAD